MAQGLLLAILLSCSASHFFCMRVMHTAAIKKGVQEVSVNDSMLSDDPNAEGHITCPVLNALVQNGDMVTFGENKEHVDADTVVNSLMRAGLNQPKYAGPALPPGITQSNAFEYTFGIFLKNKAADYRDADGHLTLPIKHFPGSNHEHNSHTGITTKENVPFDEAQWLKLEKLADSDEGKCFSRNGWAAAMFYFEYEISGGGYDGGPVDNDKVRSNHSIHDGAGSWWPGSIIVNTALHFGASHGNAVLGKRLVAGISQVMNGMVNLFWTGDYGNMELYEMRAKQVEENKKPGGKPGWSFPWLDQTFCLPVAELKSLLRDGTYPPGYSAMAREDYENGKVWKYPISRCTAAYFQQGGLGFPEDEADRCQKNIRTGKMEPPLVEKSVVSSSLQLLALHTLFGKR